jgi:hypothetical protein
MLTTPQMPTPEIETFCASIVPGVQPRPVPVRALRSVADDCFGNVRRQIDAEGGEMVCGWAIYEWPRVMLEAQFHAVWKPADEERLIDLTLQEDGATTTLFLPEAGRRYEGQLVPSHHLALTDDPDVRRFIEVVRKLTQMEVESFQDTSYEDPDHSTPVYRTSNEEGHRQLLWQKEKVLARLLRKYGQ